VWYKNVGTTFFRFVTNHAFDRRTDRQTVLSCLVRADISCSAVETCVSVVRIQRKLTVKSLPGKGLAKYAVTNTKYCGCAVWDI